MKNPWMKKYYTLKKLGITEEQLDDLVMKHRIIHRRYDDTYLRADVEKESKNETILRKLWTKYSKISR